MEDKIMNIMTFAQKVESMGRDQLLYYWRIAKSDPNLSWTKLGIFWDEFEKRWPLAFAQWHKRQDFNIEDFIGIKRFYEDPILFVYVVYTGEDIRDHKESNRIFVDGIKEGREVGARLLENKAVNHAWIGIKENDKAYQTFEILEFVRR